MITIFNDSSRKDKIYQKLKELTISLQLKNGINKVGFEAEYIGRLVGIDRANTSRELNKLVKEKKSIKIKGKPVLYLDRKSLEEKWGCRIENSVFGSCEEFISLLKESKLFCRNGESQKNTSSNIFLNTALDNMIGAHESLKEQIEKAKAAILYPPNGLHTLIIGPTGAGKTTFAEAMYKSAIQLGIFPDDAPFVIFNCADYADNPQLLLSQLFGYVKGAFTGAVAEKKGIIDEADGGVLFLDEIHRLPAEGQEMLFTLIDKGIYRRMGESTTTRKAKVLIIAATTEDPRSVLLSTFLRRVPVLIQLPSLESRTLKERFTFISQFFWEESRRIKIPIKASKEVIKALLLYECLGNIGQLKSDIQLICAKAFLEYMVSKKEMVEVKLSTLAQNIQEGLFKIKEKRNELSLLEINLHEDVIFEGNKEFIDAKDTFIMDNYKTRDDFYEIIVNNWEKYEKEGLTIQEIREKIGKEISEYFEKFLHYLEDKNETVNREVLLKFVSPNILEAVEYAISGISEKLENLITPKVVYAIALHVSTLLERIKMGSVISYPSQKNITQEFQFEYNIAKRVKEKLEEKLYVKMPESEIVFLTMFFHALRIGKKCETIGVLVIAHGDSAATTMANVANTLLGVDHAKAVDMPLKEKVEVVLDKAVKIAREIDTGKGVLLLVDMGSLVTFGEIIMQKTGIPTKTIEMVSTPLVIEATRKALMPNMNLDKLVAEVTTLSLALTKDKDLKIDMSEFDLNIPFFKKNLINVLDKTLTFLNPYKAYEVLEKVLNEILLDINGNYDDEILVKFLFHCSCMIERVIQYQSLPYEDLDFLKKTHHKLFLVIKKHFEVVEEVFGINIPDSELAYVVEIISTHFNTLLVK
ncbi:Transcriptional regulator containing an AAA-type ATPase domain and a DNA-binding domain [Thermoanaerobacter uzonensis DSM 18761]|uniref:Transcriptional regulator containing an AAA-type ATPase domain and a DNA-binding domain n=1 Tax=Thermoanaerobacter uzonensis DSM 18761 TaxID=1123369 RepID=A0A1M4WZF8_9THEO|nr:sigma-54-dependent transcriptional regulator [Thermoanaerobacter uzonensis]SHE86651.1 Transcriptional regulator containing an AAA-type ATPase domain and a DNA-binding domain [Thermoanaerobacter uzonensis DSM 18761]